MRLIKVLRPDIKLIVGGPEVSHEINQQEITAAADFVITGAADESFAQLCRELVANNPPPRIVSSLPIDLNTLPSPYEFYTDEDVAQRVLYVEASRGCPFKCEFCLSSLDKTATAFELDAFLEQMQLLIERGARQFKFVDRTFNLKAETSRRILEFFLKQIDKGFFLHFELIPDRLPDVLLDLLPHFPPDSLGPQEIQVGILKRLRGTPIDRHSSEFDMRYMSTPPYRVLSHKDASFETVQRMVRFARYWDLVGNSGRFPATLPLILEHAPFRHFMQLSDWLFATTTQTHRIALPKLIELLHDHLTQLRQLNDVDVKASLLSDHKHNKLKGIPSFMRDAVKVSTRQTRTTPQRQQRHVGSV